MQDFKNQLTMDIIKLQPSLVLTLIVLCAASFAQTNQSSPTQAGTPQAQNARVTPVHDTPSLQDRYPRYQVMPSDILAISFPLIPEIQTVSVTVQPDGFINMPNGVGTIYVKGLTIPQIVDNLTKAYSATMHNPIVNVDITNFQPPQFTVNGQVGKPGQYPLRIDTTISEGIAVAGGFLASAKTQVFLFHRISTDWVEVKKVNLKDVLNGRNIHEDVHLQPGDMVFVPDKFITKFRQYVPYGFGSAVGWNGNGFLTQ
jgi:polysaccharide biosynthesis/export protein